MPSLSKITEIGVLIQEAELLGWTVTRTRSNHFRFMHVRAARPVFGERSKCPRALKNLQGSLRRAITLAKQDHAR